MLILLIILNDCNRCSQNIFEVSCCASVITNIEIFWLIIVVMWLHLCSLCNYVTLCVILAIQLSLLYYRDCCCNFIIYTIAGMEILQVTTWTLTSNYYQFFYSYLEKLICFFYIIFLVSVRFYFISLYML